MTRSGQGRFVGRERDRELLDGRLLAALAGEGQLVLVAGEPGVGKTRIAEETRTSARELGMDTGWGRSGLEDGSPPYWPLRQVLRTLTGSAALPALPVEPAAAPAQERFRLFEALADHLIAAAEPNGLLIVLDDLQWADPASLRLLVHLAMVVPSSRLMIIATYRDTETAGQEPLRDALAELAREPVVTRLRLVGLTEPEVAAHLAEVTGWAVPESVAAAVCRRTKGNPFFVGELGRLLAHSPDVTGTTGALPDGVRDAVRGRLARLSPACRAVVSAAAVLGSELDPATLIAATDHDLGVVLAALDEAGAAGIIAGDPGRFTHDLIREAARLETATVDRLDLHRRAAVHLSGLGDAGTRVAEIAFHHLESLPAGDADLAVSWARRAAERATAQLAWEEAAALYRRAVAVAADPAPRADLLLAMARAQVRAYDMAGARRSLVDAVELARARGDAELIADAVLTMEGVTDFLWNPTGRALCAEALAGIGAEDSALRARLLAEQVVTNSWHSLAEAGPRSATALAMAERVGDRRAVVAALRARQMALSGPEGAAERLAIGDRMVAVGQDGPGADDTVLWGRLWRFDALAQRGEIDLAEAELTPISAVAEQLRSPLARWHSFRCRAAIAWARGRFDEAVELGRRSWELAIRAGHLGAQVPAVGFLLMVRAMTGGTWPGPEEQFGEQVSTVAMPPTSALRGAAQLTLGEVDEARRIYQALPPLNEVPAFMMLSALSATVELAAEFDDRDQAEQLYRILAPHAELFTCSGAGVIAINGSTHLPLGIAATTVGRLDDAVRHLRTAAEVNERAGMPPFVATARYRLATALVRRKRPGDREEAAGLAVSVGAMAERLGMVPLRQQAERLAASLEGRVSNGLTRREREVAVLVAQGLTNRQIAATAHISERTVESHVQHILGKLDFTNRAQVASWVTAGQMGTGVT